MDLISSTYQSASKRALSGQKTVLYDAAKETRHFCHHPALGELNGALYAMWSNGVHGEDEIGQRVMMAKSLDGEHWSQPRVLCEAFAGERTLNTLTAAGFHTHAGQMTAYVGAYEYARLEELGEKGCSRVGIDCVNTKLYALTTHDGEYFSDPIDLGVPLCPNYGPRRLLDGRLLMTGNWAHAVTDDPSGLTGWRMHGFCQDTSLLEKPVRDDPSYFWGVSKVMGFKALCEGAFIEDGGALHMLHRNYGPTLYQSDSFDGGEHWSVPRETSFPNGNSKFFVGKLPDGRHLWIGNPEQGGARCPLVLSLSEDGRVFDTHYLIETERVPRKFDGLYKGGLYAYPHALVHQGALYVIYSLWKEDIVVQKIPLDSL